MTVFESVLLGLVQGLTEFLPVSSSGHLVLGQELLGIRQPGVTFEVVVHVATAASAILYFWRDIATILRDLVVGGPGRRLGLLVLLASVPAGVAGFTLKGALDVALDTPVLAAACLIATGGILLLVRIAPSPGGEQGPKEALLVGCAQALALLPGISRSGTTIVAGVLLRDHPERAVRFSFLMLIPATLGAGLLQALTDGQDPTLTTTKLLAGGAAAFVSGLAAIRLVVLLMPRGRLAVFAPYCILAGAGGLLWLLLR